MTYKPHLTQGGWVIQVFEGNDYIGNIANEHKTVSKDESLTFFDKLVAESYIQGYLGQQHGKGLATR